LEYELDEFPVDFSGEVRLFPLPNLVLYPGCVQPLHIFESRYCEMLEDALQDDRLLAIATLLPGYEPDYYSRPPVADAICVGHVVMHEVTPKKTHNLILIGARRARIKHEITPVRSFRRAAVEIIEDSTAANGTVAVQQLGRQLAERCLAATESAEQLATDFREGKITLSSLSDVIAFHFPLELSLKLQLLEEPNAIERARLLLRALDSDVDASGGESKSQPVENISSKRRPFPPRFGNN